MSNDSNWAKRLYLACVELDIVTFDGQLQELPYTFINLLYELSRNLIFVTRKG